MLRALLALLAALTLIVVVDYWRTPNIDLLTQRTVDVKDTFEQVIRQHAQQQVAPTKQGLKDACAKQLKCASRSDLFDRYLSYKKQLAAVIKERASLSFQAQFLLMQQQQQTLFNDAERALLFSTENQWNQYMIARLQIAQDETLNQQQKAALTEQLLAQQPEQLRASYAPTTELAIASDQALTFNQVAAQLGSEKASAVERVNQQQARWMARVEAAKTSLAKMSNWQEKQNYLDTHFTSGERKRLSAYLP